MSERFLSTTSGTPEVAIRSPLIADADHDILNQPNASFLAQNTPITLTPHESFATHLPANTSGNLLSNTSNTSRSELVGYPETIPLGTSRKRRTPILVLLGISIVIVVVLAVILPVYFAVIKPNQDQNSQKASIPATASTTTSAGSNSPDVNMPQPSPSLLPTSGGDGSTVTKDDGSTFTYVNKFGGFCKFSLLACILCHFWRQTIQTIPAGTSLVCVLHFYRKGSVRACQNDFLRMSSYL